MQAERIVALALALAALGLSMLAAVVIAQLVSARRGARALELALDRRAAGAAASVAASVAAVAMPPAGASEAAPPTAGSASRRADRAGAVFADAGTAARGPSAPNVASVVAREVGRRSAAGERHGKLLGRFARIGAGWLDTPLGRRAVAAEDRRLLDQCGFADANARGLFLMLRLGCAAVLSLLIGWLWGAHVAGAKWLVYTAAALTAGFMLPKLALARRAAARRHSVAEEMPLFVDLLRLLQGVGLSLDQSLQVTINDFRAMLPVLSGELEIAQRQFVAGRTREQSLQRLATSFGNEDLRAVVRLMIQVDRHGGAVQEPLKQFGDRLRETRRAMLRERVGRLTVKMAGVMILTLLPALLIVTAGPGLITVTHTLSAQRR
ncbi:MAG TPA: type II secretion system F family protein [Trinickia sp.]|jgi:tight adherence protein C|nr:type II secretion system F family protein [Trinickia sp.]